MVHTCDCDAGHKESQSDESISPELIATLNSESREDLQYIQFVHHLWSAHNADK